MIFSLVYNNDCLCSYIIVDYAVCTASAYYRERWVDSRYTLAVQLGYTTLYYQLRKLKLSTRCKTYRVLKSAFSQRIA